jgi:hypothetical protein
MRRALLATLMVGMLFGCAQSPTLSTQDRLDLYRQHAGPQLMSFRLDNFMGTHSWTALGSSALVLRASGSTYLIELRGSCTGLSTAPRIQISNSQSQIVTRFDSVIPQTAPQAINRSACRINSIRQVDMSAVRDTKAEMRDAELIDRSTLPAEPDQGN